MYIKTYLKRSKQICLDCEGPSQEVATRDTARYKKVHSLEVFLAVIQEAARGCRAMT